MLPSSWAQKFGFALQGLRQAFVQERSFRVHLPVAGMVVLAGIYFKLESIEWIMLILTISLVISLELLNSAVERLAKAITLEQHPQIGAALDMAAAAVLFASCGAVLVGLVIFWPRAWQLIVSASS